MRRPWPLPALPRLRQWFYWIPRAIAHNYSRGSLSLSSLIFHCQRMTHNLFVIRYTSLFVLVLLFIDTLSPVPVSLGLLRRNIKLIPWQATEQPVKPEPDVTCELTLTRDGTEYAHARHRKNVYLVVCPILVQFSWTLAASVLVTKGPFSSIKKLKIFAQYPSHRILRNMYRVLNVDEKKTNCTVR